MDLWVLLDARAVMHHSFNMGKDPEGILGEDGEMYNTAEFAFRNFLSRYMAEIFKLVPPSKVLVAMDGGIEYRRALHPNYKRKREEAKKTRDPVAVEQSAKFYRSMQKFWGAVGCTIGRVKGVEADDLLAYWAKTLPGNIMIYTTDGDLVALSSEKVTIKLKLDTVIDEMFKFSGSPTAGVPIKAMNLMTVCKSLLGDVSDQYGGIKGFGPAKWDELVADFGYDGIQELEECVKTGEYTALNEALEACPDSKPLQLIAKDTAHWEVQYELALMHPKLCAGVMNEKIIKIEWYKRVPELARLTEVLKDNYCIETHLDVFEDLCVQMWLLDADNIEDGDIQEALEAFKNSDIVSFDYETQDAHYENLNRAATKGNYLDIMTSKLAGASFCFGSNSQYCFYIPLNHKDSANLESSTVKYLLEEGIKAGVQFVAHNNAFELAVTQLNLGIHLPNIIDTSIMSSYVDENESSALKTRSKEDLNYTQATYNEVVGDRKGMFEITAEEVIKYGCDDSITTAHLYNFYRLRMLLEGSWDFYKEFEVYAQTPLTEAFINGTEIDWPRLTSIHEMDKETIKVKTKYLRKSLQENCLNENKEGHIAYTGHEIINVKALEFTKLKKKFDGLVSSGKEDPENKEEFVNSELATFLENFKEKCIAGSFYVPYSEEKEFPEFKPTIVNINKVVKSLGIETPLESIAKGRVSEWIAEVRNYDFDSEEKVEDLSESQDTLLTLIAEALPEFKAREGVAYTKLSEFCVPYLGAAKIIKSGTELNTASPSQMQQLMYCMMGLPVRLHSKAQIGSGRQKLGLEGSPATDDLAIKTALAEDLKKEDWRYSTLEALNDIKEASTRCSLYHTKYPLWKHPDDGRMHPQIRNCGTVTRRPSGTSPNILQVSKHQIEAAMRGIYIPHKEKYNIEQQVFIPYEEPTVTIAIDFSQQELRILASECGDVTMQSAYIGAERKDIHSLTASGIAQKDYDAYMAILTDKNNPEFKAMTNIRKKPAKQTNFLIAYMGTAFTLATRLIIKKELAEQFMDRTFALYPNIRPWQVDMGNYARAHGYTQTAYGNRRHLNSSVFSKDSSKRRRMERQAANAVIQGTASDILKIVLATADKTRLFKETNSILLAPVYDEITASVPISKAVEYVNRLTGIMELTPPNHAVPMEADVSIGPDWQDLKELGVRPSAESIEAACERAVKAQERKAA